MNVTFNGYDCDIEFAQYLNENTAIQLIGKKGTVYEGELIAVASVNVEKELPEEFVGIKNWSENEGMTEALIKANVIENNLLFVEPTGFVAIEYYKLTDAALKQLSKFKEDFYR